MDHVGAELDDVASLVGVTHEVGMDALVCVGVGGIRPQDVENYLLLKIGNLMGDLHGALDPHDVVEGLD